MRSLRTPAASAGFLHQPRDVLVGQALDVDGLAVGEHAPEQRTMADPAEFQSDFLGDDGTGEIAGAPPISTSRQPVFPRRVTSAPFSKISIQPLPSRVCAAAQSRPTISERRMPDIEKLEDAGLLGRTSEALPGGDALASELRGVLGLRGDEDEVEEDG